MNPYEIIKRPLLTEKITRGRENRNAYAFEVSKKMNKIQIKEAIENIFKVKVIEVNTITMPGKSRRFGVHRTPKRTWKKAIAVLKKGEHIELYEGA